MNWQTVVGLLLLVCALLYGAYYLGGEMKEREIALLPKDTTTTVVVAPHVLPPAVVTPNPAPVTIIRPDSARVDSLLSQITNRDSLIRELLSTVGTEQEFVSKDPTGLAVSGLVTVMYSPVERHFLTQITLNPIAVPATTVTVTQTIIEDRLAWEWIAGGAAVGIITGSLIAQ